MNGVTLVNKDSTVTEASFRYEPDERRARFPTWSLHRRSGHQQDLTSGSQQVTTFYGISPTGTSPSRDFITELSVYFATELTLDSESYRRTPSTEWDREIRHLRSLEPNWDTYGAEAPAESAITTAESFLSWIGETDLTPARIAPSAEGGVAVTFRREARSYMIEFFNDGDISAVWSDGMGTIDAEELSVEDMGPVDWWPVLSRINEFLVG